MIKYFSEIPGAPNAIGPYSVATAFNNLVCISGQIPLDPETGLLVEGGIDAQTDRVMRNLSTILRHMDLNFSHVLKSTILLSSMSDFAAVNAIYERHLQGSKPARATFAVAGLPKGALIEIEMLAARP